MLEKPQGTRTVLSRRLFPSVHKGDLQYKKMLLAFTASFMKEKEDLKVIEFGLAYPYQAQVSLI